MAFHKVAQASQVPPGSLTEVLVGDKPIALCNVGGALHAIEGLCPHRGGALGQGALHGNMVVCPWHAWEFDCTTGQNDYNPNVRVAKYDVHVSAGDILIDLP